MNRESCPVHVVMIPYAALEARWPVHVYTLAQRKVAAMPTLTTQQLEKRERYPVHVIMLWKDTMRERIDATRKLVDFKAHRGDLHCHSTYSDGTGTVDEIKEWVDRAGLDFFFVTDHGTVAQKRVCKKYDRMWWGQEPGTEYHHIGILGLDRKVKMTRNLARDYERVKKLGGFPYIAHPCGWFPVTRYSQEQKDALHVLGDWFAIEIINGANNIFDCYDVTDEMSIELWDRYLCEGKTVVGLGCTDAHLPHAIGDVWTAVLSPQLTKQSVLKALWQGHCFVSDAPFVHLSLGDAIMGDTVTRRKGKHALSYQCADSRGLDTIRIIKDGKALKEMDVRGQVVVKGEIRDSYAGGRSYYRLECLARDQRRAYTNPIYIVNDRDA